MAVYFYQEFPTSCHSPFTFPLLALLTSPFTTSATSLPFIMEYSHTSTAVAVVISSAENAKSLAQTVSETSRAVTRSLRTRSFE